MHWTPSKASNPKRVIALAVTLLLVGFGLVGTASADWLVTRDGQRVETKGPWKVKRNQVIFTLPNGTLSSLRLSEVDLDLSQQLTVEMSTPRDEPVAEEAPAKPSVLVLTNRDVAQGTGGTSGPESLVDRLRRAHQYQDLNLVMGLVNWQDTPDSIRDVMQTQFEWMLERRIQDVVLSEVGPNESLQQVVNDVTFEPNVDVTHKIEVQFIPDPDADQLLLDFYIGTRLGSYFIAAARPFEEGF